MLKSNLKKSIASISSALPMSHYTGWKFIISYGLRRFIGLILTPFIESASHLSTLSTSNFRFNSHSYPYFKHPYNHTSDNERAVEIALIHHLLNQSTGKKILELGNVSSHYFSIHHTVIDKYELADSVHNLDIAYYQTSTKFDLIFSLSTLEHVGWDDPPKSPQKAFNTLQTLRQNLSPRGFLFVSFPLGYNSFLDNCLKNELLSDFTPRFLKRISTSNLWIETNYPQVSKSFYGFPYHHANAICILTYEKSRRSHPLL